VGSVYLDLAALDPAALATAQEALETVRQREPGDAQTALTLGRVYLERQQADKAVEVFRDLVRLAPQQRLAYALLVEALLRAEKGKEAEGVLGEMLSVDPESLDARLTLAELQGQRGDHKAALQTLTAAPDSERGDPRLRRQLAWSQYLTGDLDRALGNVEPLIKELPDDSQLVLLKGMLFTALGRNAEAAQLLGALHGTRPKDPALAYALARVLEREGRRGEAAKVMSEAVSGLAREGKGDEERQARLELAQVYFDGKEWGKVADTLAPLLELKGKPGTEPARDQALLLSADALIEKKSFDQALALLARNASSPLPPVVAGKRAEVLYRSGREAEARRELEALGGPPQANPQAVLSAAQAYQRLNRYEESVPLLVPLVARQPDSIQAHFLLAAAYERTGKRQQSVTEFRRLLALDPAFHAALNYLGYMFAERGENLDEARTLVEQAVALDPDNGAYVDSLGWVYFRQGRLEQARATLERATHLETEDATVHEHLGDVYGAMGQVDHATQAYRRAIELGTSDPAKAELVRHKLDQLEQSARKR
ncbi:MAG: tetratricopeptide repeat protein, partial [Acidobacteriota bacterium]|nr:tetratricopeptide repeat protein [Acidobacteriota bacterium]